MPILSMLCGEEDNGRLTIDVFMTILIHCPYIAGLERISV